MESCCIGLLLCALAFVDKQRWEQATTGAADLFDKGPLGLQLVATRIIDYVQDGSQKSLMTLFHSVERQSVPSEDQTETKQDRIPEAVTVPDDQEAGSESLCYQEKPTDWLNSGTTGKKKRGLVTFADCEGKISSFLRSIQLFVCIHKSICAFMELKSLSSRVINSAGRMFEKSAHCLT